MRQRNSCHIFDPAMLPPASVRIPTVVFKSKIKACISPGERKEGAINARTLFNCMYQKQIRRSFEAMEVEPSIYMEMANCVKDNIRVFVYQCLNIKIDSRTYSSVKGEY
eukprot:gb/GEZJ01004708.1/.p2 GENE.gb/GEZJ01004708.1/~~gb/GEZJ01004708.1/.p2  ORF type:complete len:109 (-),score=8.57 gb/GEZJ01004708.1/:926-1252(-)